ncbi:glycosyltransferase [Sphingomonas hankyongi]|uniref:Glycosyltransferase n=1 Tax=Sphingomonas hankyongi TaxID=2908209 RepID=A0ABT0S2Y3_9SPHN|nr:glycosyltransferase [Sphingomonas hankyongi]
MASFNGERFIGQQLQSLAAQTKHPDELVICDDASIDRTVAITEDFARTAPFPVHVHRNAKNLGYSRNFSKAMSRTTGDLVFIADQDDVWYPHKIDRVSAVLRDDPSALACVNDQLIVDADGASGGETVFGKMRKAGFPDNYLIAGSCTAIARPLLELLLPVPEVIPYDSWIGWAADLLGAKRLLEEPMQIYRRHGGNTTDPDVVQSASRWAEIRKYAGRDPRPAWKAEIAWRDILTDRFASACSSLHKVIPDCKIDAAILSNAQRVRALRQRLTILEEPRTMRGNAIIRAWRHGLYDEFNGLASAARDWLRA